jgi:hypothetical protein
VLVGVSAACRWEACASCKRLSRSEAASSKSEVRSSSAAAKLTKRSLSDRAATGKVKAWARRCGTLPINPAFCSQGSEDAAKCRDRASVKPFLYRALPSKLRVEASR